MSRKILIKCEGARSIPYKSLHNFQGDLKILTEQNYQRFKNNLLINGFIEPIAVWMNEGKAKILNGHQRLATIKRMVENEGFSIDELPISIVEARSYEDAKMKVLAMTSEYGEMTTEGLINFTLDMNMGEESLNTYLSETANLSRIKVDEFMERYREIGAGANQEDPFDVGTAVIGGDSPTPVNSVENTRPDSEPASGLRLLQVFLTNDQLGVAKKQIEEITAKYELKNVTEAVLKALELATAKPVGKKNANTKPKKAK